MTTIRKQIVDGPAVLLREAHDAEVVTFQMWIGVGAADETPEEAGLAHVLEHMLFKGTRRRKVGEIARDVERAGGYINAWTSHDETVFHITLASASADQGLDVLFDAVANATLDPVELERELAVILEEIRMGRDNPERMNTEQLFRTMFRQHPYGRSVIGSEKTVSHFSPEVVTQFYRKWYAPSNLLLVAAGDFDPEAMFKKMTRLWAKVAPARLAVAVPRVRRAKESAQRTSRWAHCHMPTTEAHLAIGFPVVGLDHPDIPALDMLAAIVGQGVSSRLETRVRRGRGLATDIRAICHTPRDMGLFAIFAATPPSRVKTLVTAVAQELQRLCDDSFPGTEIEKARTLLLSEEIYAEETVDGMARKLGYYGLHAANPDYDIHYSAAISTLDATALQRVARRYLAPDRVSVSLVLPVKTRVSAESLKKTVLQGIAANMRSKRTVNQSRSGVSEPKVISLKSGDTLIVRENPESRLVAARAVFMGGLRMEPSRQLGITSLLSSSITRGTTTRSGDQLGAEMDSLACSVSGFAGRSTLGIAGEFLTQNFSRGFPLFADCLRNAVFPPDEVAREKEIALEDIAAATENPEYQVFSRFQSRLFGAHPYGRPMGGTAETVSQIESADLAAFLSAATAPGRMVLAVDGGVDHREIVDLLDAHMGFTGKTSGRLKAPGQWKTAGRPLETLAEMPREQSHLVVGFQGVTLTDPDRFALDVLVEMLGGHGGRLFSSIREKSGLAYSVSMVSFEGIEPGYVATYAATSPGKELQVYSAMRRELDRIIKTAVPGSELDRIVRHITGGRKIGRQRAVSRVAGMALGYLYGLGVDADVRYVEGISKVDAAAIARVARRLIREDHMVVSCVGPGVEKLRFI